MDQPCLPASASESPKILLPGLITAARDRMRVQIDATKLQRVVISGGWVRQSFLSCVE